MTALVSIAFHGDLHDLKKWESFLTKIEELYWPMLGRNCSEKLLNFNPVLDK